MMDMKSDAADAVIDTTQKITEEMKASKERSANEMSDAINNIKNRNKLIKKNIRSNADSILAEIDKLS